MPSICANLWSMATLNSADIPAIRRALLRWHLRHAQHAPWRESRDPYHALVAAVMAQQTQMSRVLPKYDEFMEAFPTVEALAAASTGDVLRVWAPLGYNMRALRLHRAARRIVREGAFPRSAGDLETIEGVGPFTAAIVASFAFAEPVPAIDTNVRRIVQRLTASTNGGVAALAANLMSRRAPDRWNQAMMDLGAMVCTARAPKCDSCPVARWCRSRGMLARGTARAAEPRATYRPEPPFKHSRRYYRGRIVEALRALPEGKTITIDTLYPQVGATDSIDRESFNGLIAALERDGLLVLAQTGRVQLP
jgi:A/G-specific adenine glycosylase